MSRAPGLVLLLFREKTSELTVQKRSTADRVAARLVSEGHEVAGLHGAMEKEDRDATLDGFRNGKTKVLITTNVIARGIDIQQVNMVVNYDVPRTGPEFGFRVDVENYIHRIGASFSFWCLVQGAGALAF